EGVPGNMGVVLPQSGFLKALRDMCNQHGIVLIVDEVMSGFRLCYGGAQKVYDVIPDITCLGKVIGGGLPVGAFGGKKKIMEMLAPSGPVYQAGTLSGNPLAMTAGIETLRILKDKGVYEKLENTTKGLCNGLEAIAKKRGVPVQIARAGAMFTLFFNDRPVDNYEDAKKSNLERFAKYFKKMLESGIYLAPSQFEAVFVSLAHTKADIEKMLYSAKKVFKGL
ncbi:MAG: aminotransferase class III-fold pyridoxal phosphate-dependent enzyme, partial [Deltaproteobacteria bacterium]|nr:aminotransferase class III-fold pyridoxal phosphate-dependent enzyme [Deltaproteobacteria bacterium]